MNITATGLTRATGAAAAVLFASLWGRPAITAADFTVI